MDPPAQGHCITTVQIPALSKPQVCFLPEVQRLGWGLLSSLPFPDQLVGSQELKWPMETRKDVP